MRNLMFSWHLSPASAQPHRSCGRYCKGEMNFPIYRHIHPGKSLHRHCFKHLAVLLIWLNWKYCDFSSFQIQEVCLLSGKFNLNRNYAILPHLTLQCIHCRSVFQGLLPSLQSSPKNVIYTESWHLDELQSPHMGIGVSSSHQAKNHPLFTVSRLGLVGDGFFTITSIHEGRALGSTLNSSSLSYRKQRNSCHAFPVMLLVFKCCSPAGVGGGWEPISKKGLTYFHDSWSTKWTNCSKIPKGGKNQIHPNSK